MKNNNISTFSQLLDEKYGPLGSPKRTEWQQQFEAFKIGVLIEEARKKQGPLKCFFSVSEKITPV